MSVPGSVFQTVSDAMIITPKTLSVEISLADARRAFADTHVHMLLLTRDGVLHGTLVRDDLRPGLDPRRPVVGLATLAGRTIGADRRVDEAQNQLDLSMTRRLAVTDADGRLLGLLCLKRSRDGFCAEADVLARAHQRTIDCARA
jgi:CBS domain-containing protein